MPDIINKINQDMYYVSPTGVSVMGRTKVYETYSDMLRDTNPPKFAWCLDATEDSTVNQGAAFYVYRNHKWQKLYESEAMDNENFGVPEGWDELVATVERLEEIVQELQGHRELIDHANNLIIHVTQSDKTNWNNKVDKLPGKGLSSNDFTTEEKAKLESLQNYDDSEVKQSISKLQQNKLDRTELFDLRNRVGTLEERVTELINDVAIHNVQIGALSEEIMGSRDIINNISDMVGYEAD